MHLSHIKTRAGVMLPKMEQLAQALSYIVQSGDMITLRGDVGAGKTTFARLFIQALAKEAVEVTSPTFNLMQSYDVQLASGIPETVWHLDLYRLEEPEEAEPLGLRELEQHIMLIEWPEIIEHSLPKTRLDISFVIGDAMEQRDMVFSGNEFWQQRLAAVMEKI